MLNVGEVCEKMGYWYGNGVLFYGLFGCGKIMFVYVVVGSVGVVFIFIFVFFIVGGMLGELEKNIRDVFDEVICIVLCFIFFDEIDVIVGKRESVNKGMEGRIVVEIMNGMDWIKRNMLLGKNVVVLVVINRLELFDLVIWRWFGLEVDMGMLSERVRE